MIASLILAATLFAQPAHERGWSSSTTSAPVETALTVCHVRSTEQSKPHRRLRIGGQNRTGHRESTERRLTTVQARIDRTMDLETVKRLNAEYARLQRELDERDMAKVRAVSSALEGK